MEGVVLAVEKRATSVLMEPRSIEKILEIDSHIGKVTLCDFSGYCLYCLACAVSGLVADARTMVDKARVEAQVLYANIEML